MKKILGIGAALTDVLIDIKDDAILEEFGFLRGSMNYVDKAKQTHILQKINSLGPKIVTGGSSANCVAVAAYCGGQTGFIGCVGSDDIGLNYEKQLQVRGIDPILKKSIKESSGSVISIISSDAERTMATYYGACSDVEPEMLTLEVFAKYDYLFVEGYMVFNRPYLTRALELAKEAGLKIAFDMASFNIVEQNREYMAEIIEKYVDIVFANEEESKVFGNVESIADIVVRKLGAKGAIVNAGGKQYSVSADKNVIIRDKTGAGDAFAGGFLYGMAQGFDVQKCAEIGARMGDLIVQELGAKLPIKK